MLDGRYPNIVGFTISTFSNIDHLNGTGPTGSCLRHEYKVTQTSIIKSLHLNPELVCNCLRQGTRGIWLRYENAMIRHLVVVKLSGTRRDDELYVRLLTIQDCREIKTIKFARHIYIGEQ